MYAQQGLQYYVIFDPENILEHGVLRAYRLVEDNFEPAELLQDRRFGGEAETGHLQADRDHLAALV
jgi:hypothetical protein